MNQKQCDISNLQELANYLNYSFVDTLKADLESKKDGKNHFPREVFSGHYVPVIPTPITNPIYISHSKQFFKELGFCDHLATSDDFMALFSGDTSHLPDEFKKLGWATGYALSIYGTEYYDQCPFKTGNGYGDGRAISILELLIDGKRWEMQLKGGGRTPYCRGADGRAVLRSSVREFLAQEHMDALRIPTSRSLTLYTSNTETVKRPWFHNNSYSRDPELMIEETVAITTRVAPSFLRVGQIELFGRRVAHNDYPEALNELTMIAKHLIEREYKNDIDNSLPFEKQVVILARLFCDRLTSLVVNWIRVGYCQGNFNSDNCAAGGFTLDYGPFGFIDLFDPEYQPWTGGGKHFSFFNQPNAAKRNFEMFYRSLKHLVIDHKEELDELKSVRDSFVENMEAKWTKMWSDKLGVEVFNDNLLYDLINLMIETNVDYTIFFRELSSIPNDISTLSKSFYEDVIDDELLQRWSEWLLSWSDHIKKTNSEEYNCTNPLSKEKLSLKMKQTNPKYTLREWFLVPAYKAAQKGDYSLIHELQEVMNDPYSEQSNEIEEKYYKLKPLNLFEIAGISHVSCSS